MANLFPDTSPVHVAETYHAVDVAGNADSHNPYQAMQTSKNLESCTSKGDRKHEVGSADGKGKKKKQKRWPENGAKMPVSLSAVRNPCPRGLQCRATEVNCEVPLTSEVHPLLLRQRRVVLGKAKWRLSSFPYQHMFHHRSSFVLDRYHDPHEVARGRRGGRGVWPGRTAVLWVGGEQGEEQNHSKPGEAK